MDGANTDGEDDAAGWTAIDTSLAAIYPEQQPRHVGTMLKYRLGGPDPLDGISACRREDPLPHWHYVTYGFSELYAKESDDPETSGYGFELTFRLRAGDEPEPPRWVFSFLQNLARYVFKSGNVFSPGDWMTANGPIALDTATKICSMAFVQDPELPPITTPNGALAFIQVLGLTVEEELACKQWRTDALIQTILPYMPLWICDLARGSLLNIPELRAQVDAGIARDGSSSGYMFTDVLSVRERKRLLRSSVFEVELGARQVDELRTLLPLRLPFGRSFRFQGREWSLDFKSGSENRVSLEEDTLTVSLNASAVTAFVQTLQAREGNYQVDGVPLMWCVKKTLLRDADGNLLESIG